MVWFAKIGVRGCSWRLCRRVNAAPIRKSSSILAATAFAWSSSSSIGSLAARRTWLKHMSTTKSVLFLGTTYALSVLLNLARLVWILGFPFLAWWRTSLPMCSPSRSQSVQINKPLLYFAWSWIFSAIARFSYTLSGESNEVWSKACEMITYLAHLIQYRSLKKEPWRTGHPTSVSRFEVKAS